LPPEIRRFVAYYRVSTDKQGRSGLGLEAQRMAVSDYLKVCAGEIAAEYTEAENGKRSDRPELTKAIEASRRRRATLIIAKLDRLARNTKFLLTLLDSGIAVQFCDLPHVTGAMGRFIVTQMAAVAELEAGLVSERTKAALLAAKARGTKLGNPRPAAAARSALAARIVLADQFAANVLPVIRDIQRAGHESANSIASKLNERQVATRRGGRWTHVQVVGLLQRHQR
jgi:DNA invertase Pin-like site-specific DNA recombinase